MALELVAEESGNRLNIDTLEYIRSGTAESLSAQDILTWGLENFTDKIALSCSFGAPEGLVLLDMMHRIDPAARVFVLDTGRLPQATYDLIDRVRDRYDKTVEVIFPAAERVQSMVSDGGLNLFYESVEKRELCCRIRKVEPLNRFLSGTRRLGDRASPRPEQRAQQNREDRNRPSPRGHCEAQPDRRLVTRAGARLRERARCSDQSPPRGGLPIGGLRPLLATDRAWRRSAFRSLVVGGIRPQGVWDPPGRKRVRGSRRISPTSRSCVACPATRSRPRRGLLLESNVAAPRTPRHPRVLRPESRRPLRATMVVDT